MIVDEPQNLAAGPLPMTGQRFPVEVFAIQLAVLPATKQNANPLESQSPHDRVPRLALGTLLLVVGLRPGRGADGMGGPLMKRRGGVVEKQARKRL